MEEQKTLGAGIDLGMVGLASKGVNKEEYKHSGLGIASFITSLVSGVILFILVVIAGVMEASSIGGMDENSVGAVILGLFLIFFIAVCMVALGLGIGGLFQRERKKIFAILGVVFSGIAVMGVGLLMLIGIAMG